MIVQVLGMEVQRIIRIRPRLCESYSPRILVHDKLSWHHLADCTGVPPGMACQESRASMVEGKRHVVAPFS